MFNKSVRLDPLASTAVRSVFENGAVEVLGLPIVLDGRTATHALDARGTAFLNLTMFSGSDRALVADTGFTAHWHEITAWLDESLDVGKPVSLFPLRLTEVDSVSNVVALSERYKVDHLFGSQFQASPWFDFRIEGYGKPWMDSLTFEKAQPNGTVALDKAGARDLEIFRSPFALLSTHWIFDKVTGTLVTSDAFGYVKNRPVLQTVGLTAQEQEDIESELVGNRFWWLPGSRTEVIEDALRDLFASRQVRRIVPAHGAILEGADVVTEHVDLICSLLRTYRGAAPATPFPKHAPQRALPKSDCTCSSGLEPARGKLPRQLSKNLKWLGGCLEQSYQGKFYHAYNSLYVVSGKERSLIVEGGLPGDLDLVDKQIDEVLASGIPPIEYIFVTHAETPHASGVGRFLKRFPNAKAVGGVHDLHLVFPEYADRIQVPDQQGVDLNLGGSRFVSVPPILRDLEMTYWGYDTGSGALFPGDGFSYSHYHLDGHCGQIAEEAISLDIPDMTALFAELALGWTKFVDLEPYIKALEGLLRDLDVQMIAPTHGLPITNLSKIVPEVIDGLRLGADN